MRHRREYDRELIGKNLKLLRMEQGFTVEDVREYLQLGSVQAIYKYESGVSYPPADTLLALMELYDIGWLQLVSEQLSQCKQLTKCDSWMIMAGTVLELPLLLEVWHISPACVEEPDK